MGQTNASILHFFDACGIRLYVSSCAVINAKDFRRPIIIPRFFFWQSILTEVPKCLTPRRDAPRPGASPSAAWHVSMVPRRGTWQTLPHLASRFLAHAVSPCNPAPPTRRSYYGSHSVWLSVCAVRDCNTGTQRHGNRNLHCHFEIKAAKIEVTKLDKAQTRIAL